MFDPLKIIITSDILKLIAEIDEFKGTWQLLGRLSPDHLHMLRHVATIESIGSSTRIEGSRLSNQEVEKLLSGLKSDSFKSRDEQEVVGYGEVCQEIYASYEEMPLSENIIKQLHGWLLKYSEKDTRHRGEYKKFPNHVEAFDAQGKSLGVVFETTSPFETPFKMQELVQWTNEQLQNKPVHSLLIIGIFIVSFLAIHPFQDGNGRLSRLLTTLLLLQAGYHYVPYSSLESVVEQNKESYYIALRKTQQSLKTELPDLNPWLLFFLRSLQRQKEHLNVKISQEKLLRAHLPKLASQIVTLVTEYRRLTISELEKITKANRNTLKKVLAKMVNDKHLIRHGKGRGTWYTMQ